MARRPRRASQPSKREQRAAVDLAHPEQISVRSISTLVSTVMTSAGTFSLARAVVARSVKSHACRGVPLAPARGFHGSAATSVVGLQIGDARGGRAHALQRMGGRPNPEPALRDRAARSRRSAGELIETINPPRRLLSRGCPPAVVVEPLLLTLRRGSAQVGHVVAQTRSFRCDDCDGDAQRLDAAW
jgi:hypothetical protein